MPSSTRYTLLKAMVGAGVGERTLTELNRDFSSTGDTATSNILDAFMLEGARLFAKAHPRGWSWERKTGTLATIVASPPSGVTETIVIGGTEPWKTDIGEKIVPKDMGFDIVKARRTSAGTFRPVHRIDPVLAQNAGYSTRPTALAAGTLPTYWWTQRSGSVFTLELGRKDGACDIAIADDIDIYVSFRQELQAIDGSGSDPDAVMIWPTADDVIVYQFTRAIALAHLGKWVEYRGAMELALLSTRGRLSDLGIQEIGLEFERLLQAKDELAQGG
jgi:hypothetical protein